MQWPPPKEASPQDHRWQRCSASVDRLMCRLVSLAHGLNRAGLWHLSHLAHCPHLGLHTLTWGGALIARRPASQCLGLHVFTKGGALVTSCPLFVVLRPCLGLHALTWADATASSQGGFPSRPQVAALPPPPKRKLIVYKLRWLHALKIHVSGFTFIQVGGLPQQWVWLDHAEELWGLCPCAHDHSVAFIAWLALRSPSPLACGARMWCGPACHICDTR
jgi:hypothetical protein